MVPQPIAQQVERSTASVMATSGVTSPPRTTTQKNVRSTWTIQRNAPGFYLENRAFRFQDSAHLLAIEYRNG
jgi:hypothetical protein